MDILKPIRVTAVLAIASLPLVSQSSQKHANAEKTITVTGCLTKGAQPNEYKIMQNGTTYDLFSSSNVNMAEHVGHKVAVTGKLAPEQNAPNSASRTTEDRLDVTGLRHISATCP
jgi:hypothetical protein